MSSDTRPRRYGTSIGHSFSRGWARPYSIGTPAHPLAANVTRSRAGGTIESVQPLREALLGVMDRKHHWAYPSLTRPGLTRAQLLGHLRHEYLVYVRDFPALLGAALGVTPPIEDVRRSLAANLYEEQTGGLSGTDAHPSLFLRMMAGLGFDASSFDEDDSWLHPAAREYRAFLRARAVASPWQAGVALLTIFVEGSVNERAELAGTYLRKSGDEAVREHALVKHYGCPPEAMTLTRAHGLVEGDHRGDAWRMVLQHTPGGSPEARAVVATCEQACALWHAYRDGVAERMGS
jgi:pyrroloquinoline quinone (PQQ) biosynthesis protein C